MLAVTELSPVVGVSRACDALVLPRATYYRRTSGKPDSGPQITPRRSPLFSDN